MKEVSLENAQIVFQNIITWTKKSSKGKLEWEKACHEANMQHKIFKTSMKTHFAPR
jgi:hypothetical protein